MIGKFATSKAGHDKNTVYGIVACDNEFLYLCDGRLKTISKPKKKNMKHIQIISRTVDEELLRRFINKETIFDEEIKYVIKQYVNQMSKPRTQ